MFLDVYKITNVLDKSAILRKSLKVITFSILLNYTNCIKLLPIQIFNRKYILITVIINLLTVRICE